MKRLVKAMDFEVPTDIEVNGVMINNVPEYAVNKSGYLLAREVDGEFWFYGLYDTQMQAINAQKKVGGAIFKKD